MKVNMDRASCEVPVKAVYGGIFGGHFKNQVWRFVCNLSNVNALFAEFMGVILAIEHGMLMVGLIFSYSQTLN